MKYIPVLVWVFNLWIPSVIVTETGLSKYILWCEPVGSGVPLMKYPKKETVALGVP